MDVEVKYSTYTSNMVQAFALSQYPIPPLRHQPNPFIPTVQIFNQGNTKIA